MPTIPSIALPAGQWVQINEPGSWVRGNSYRLQARASGPASLYVGDQPNEDDSTALAPLEKIVVQYDGSAVWMRVPNFSCEVAIEDIGAPSQAGGGSLAPNAAQEKGGNLDAISEAAGTAGDAAYAGAGNSTIIGTLKGIFAAIRGVLNVRALSAAQDSVTVGGAVSLASTQQTFSLMPATGPGSTPAGCTSVSFANAGNANATVAGVAIPPLGSTSAQAALGNTLAAITYDGTGTTLLVSMVK